VSGEQGEIISIVAALVLDQGKALLVRKRGTHAFMQPGGKIHDGESELETLDRELREELGCGIVAGSERLLGHFEGLAANEPDALLRAVLYLVDLAGRPEPLAEIEGMLWLDVGESPTVELAPFTDRFVLPWARALVAEGVEK
jgi:8-oxo-dGTP diphosphatase